MLRIEDTDAARNRPEWTDGIISALAWLGIDGSQYEGPYLQSEYLTQHQEAAARLHEQGQAYYCDCTREAIVERTGDPHRGYDGFCRDRGLGPGEGRALRFRTPDEGTTVVDDHGARQDRRSRTRTSRTSSSCAPTARCCSCWPTSSTT